MPTSIGKIRIEEQELNFQFEEDKPIITYNGKIYYSPQTLLQELLVSESHLDKIAQAINFFLNGLNFHFIEDIPKYQKEYQSRMDLEGMVLEGIAPTITHTGAFDVKSMHPPKIIDNHLVFFVINDYTEAPYKVSVPVRLEHMHAYMHAVETSCYELLPYAKSHILTGNIP